MINVTMEIKTALRTQYPEDQYDVYTESIEQGFAEPCFAIHQLSADITPYPNYRTEIVQHFDVRFFPTETRPREQCRAVAATLTFLLRRSPACAAPVSVGRSQTMCCTSLSVTGSLCGRSRRST